MFDLVYVKVSRQQEFYNCSFPIFQLFLGNTDRTTIVKHFLKRPIQARYVRINPRAWHGIHICMRFEIFGCKEGKNNVHTDFTFTCSFTQQTFTCSNPTIETLEKGVK